MKYNINAKSLYRITRYHIMIIQHPTKSLLQDYEILYINEIQYLAKSLLQDYKISYINEIQYLTKSLLQDYEISYMKNYKKNFFPPLI